jgi:transposase
LSDDDGESAGRPVFEVTAAMLSPFVWGDAVSDEVVDGASGHMSGRIEVVARVSGRRHWTVEQKLMILRDAFVPNGSVRDTVERHEVGNGRLYTWREQTMSGMFAGSARPTVPTFAQVQITHEPTVPLLPAPTSPEPSGKIGIELPSGIRLSADARVDAKALARVLSVIGR